MSEFVKPQFTIIRHHGQPEKAQLPKEVDPRERWVYKADKLFVPEWGGFIPCAPYSDHFIYEVPDDIIGSKWRCSCGSMAVVVSPTGYLQDASPQGKMIVCAVHAQTGLHSTGGSRWT